MQHPNSISPLLIEQVLEKFGLHERPSIDYTGLTLLYQKWCQHIPFDNILKRVQACTRNSEPLPGSQPADFFNTWMATGAGGTCWAGNGGLCALLQSLGFPAKLGISMMVPSSLVIEAHAPKHGTVIVNFGDGPLVVDATIMHDQPIRLQIEERFSPLWGGRNQQINELWYLQWKPLIRPAVYCRIEQFDVSLSTFAAWHEHSRKLSRFNQGVIIRLAHPDRIEGIVRGHRATRQIDGTEISTPIQFDMLRQSLIEDFGIKEEVAFSLPDDEF
ncbi:MAG: hypothetical protein NT086_06575 [Proteobacteria bacterium]|nr:hypothetical protein [Pseudomonadota bacterium]